MNKKKHQQIICPSCGTQNPSDVNVCVECGRLLQYQEKRKDYRLIITLVSIVIIVAVIVIGVGGSIWNNREMRYREAKKNLEEGDTIKAVEILEEIDGYRDVDELLSEEDVVNASKYLEGKKCFEDGKYLEAMEIFVDISYYEDSENYLIDAAKSYLRGLWSDDRETYSAYGFGFDEDEFFVWDLKVTGLFATESHAERVYEYPMKDYYVFRADGELHLAIECYDNGELAGLEFTNLSENSFRCIEENAGYSRYELD